MADASPGKHVLIVSASTGGGHMRAAEGLEKCFHERYPQIKVTNVDMMQYVTWLFRKLYVDFYVDMMMRRRKLFEIYYDITDHDPSQLPLRPLRLWLQRLNARTARRKFMELKPDHVILTHFTPAEMFDRARRHGVHVPPTSVVVTDYDVHWSWVQQSLDEYFVANQEIAARLANRGIAAERVHVTGIPVCPVFSRSYSSETCKTSLGLKPAKPVVLLMAGGFGVSKIDDTARRLLAHAAGLQLIAVAGRNEQLHASLNAVAKESSGRLVALGFTTEIEKYMAASDLVISKPGGLTTSECLALGKPMIVVDPIPGQEERNATYLLEHGAGVLAYDQVGVMYKLDKILSQPGCLAQMQEAARRIGTPNAGFDVTDAIVKKYLA